ncbi:MAG: hypothetical protein IT440_00685 [Phycisphaeraceae bacterium]|nr:hypothetical protein [Phycisphaeraceae bacterium]
MTDRCADLNLTLPGQKTPAMRLLMPEWITATNLDLLKLARAASPFTGPFHTSIGEWIVDEQGNLCGTLAYPGVMKVHVRLEPRDNHVDLVFTICNLSTMPMENLEADFCVGVTAGGGLWANRDFLPKSNLDRTEDGRYWHDLVARKGAYVHVRGTWTPLKLGENEIDMDTSVLAVNNEAGAATVFLMWNRPVRRPWINDANACMHLRPKLADTLAPAACAEIHGRVGITNRGLADVWRLCEELRAGNVGNGLPAIHP